MFGLDPLAQFSKRLIGSLGDLLQQGLLQYSQAQRHVVALRARADLAKLLAPRTRSRHIGLTDVKARCYFPQPPRCCQYTIT